MPINVRPDIAQLYEEGVSYREIAKRLNISSNTVYHHIARIKQNKDAFGPPSGFDVVKITQSYDGDGELKSQVERSEPETNGETVPVSAFKDGLFEIPLSMFADKATTQFGGDGSLKNQWVKAKVDPDKLRIAFKAMFDAMCEDVPREPAATGPMLSDMDMLSAYVVGDAHFGMLAWGKECGTPFDLSIAERELKGAMEYLVARAPDSKRALIVDVGDFMHANGKKNVTPQGGAMLDVDGRFPKAIKVAVRAMRHLINAALKKHDEVHVICAPGNHNPDGSSWMQELLAVKYEDEPRVIVDQHPGAYFYHHWGKCLIGVTHGDTCKFGDLQSIMAYDQPKLWGETTHRHFLTGHIHHTKQEEQRGVFAEAFNTLAPKDGWHSMSGYRSEQQMQRIDFHKEHGEYSRGTVNPGMLET